MGSITHASGQVIRRGPSTALLWVTTGLGAVLCVASLVAAGPAGADTFPGSVALTYTGAEQSYTVPAGITLLQVEAVGGNGSPSGVAGVGMDLVVALPVVPGETLYAEVGATGGVSSFGGGAPGGTDGGSGGGASDVRTCSTATVSCPGGGTSIDSRLVVAGGGGGSGAEPAPNVYFGTSCGNSTGAGAASDNTTPVVVSSGTVLPGAAGGETAPTTPPQGGLATGGGAGGNAPDCTGYVQDFGGSVAGSSGQGTSGGAGGVPSDSPPGGGGGGGGGGYTGGGGGASGQTETEPTPNHDASDGGGGAAGSSFYSSQVTGDISEGRNAWTTVPSVTFTPLIGFASPTDGATYALGQVVDASYTCQPIYGGCSGATVPNGQPIDTSTVGVHSFEVSAFNATSTVHYTVVEPPSITSTTSTSMQVGHAATFTVTTGPSYPISPSLSDGGAVLPAGITFKDNSDGTATLAGTPGPGSEGSYPFTITASNGVAPAATQSFTLVVTDVPGAPGAVTLHTATGTFGVRWHAPSSNGGTAITGYTATASPGGKSCTSTVLGCSITGLSATTWYSVSVRASNVDGMGGRSAASAAFPATSAGLSVWGVPKVVARGALFLVGAIGAAPGSTVKITVPHAATLSCVADAAGQCSTLGHEPRSGRWHLVGSSKGKTSTVTLYVPLVSAPSSAKVSHVITVVVSHCPAKAIASIRTSDGRTFTAPVTTAGGVTFKVKAIAKGTLTLSLLVGGIAAGHATVTVS